MIVYSILLLFFSAIMIAVGIMTLCGRYDLIYDFYIARVKDLKGYTRAQGIVMLCQAAAFLLCGIFLLLPSPVFDWIAIGLFVCDLIAAFIVSDRIQKKYNGGMF